ncbi:innexin-3-like [Symsagittifera roscoffensis]|uniref:innexin-3-like n=1 Tax=Symsagittifera roscoffensis TaxID=84072 RepID=UPI00307BFEF2
MGTKQAEYMSDYCAAADFFYIPMSESPNEVEMGSETVENLTKNAPLFFLLTALLLYYPFAEWKMISRCLGMDLDSLRKTVENPVLSSSGHCVEKVATLAANQMENYLQVKRKKNSGLFSVPILSHMSMPYLNQLPVSQLQYLVAIAFSALMFTFCVNPSFYYVGVPMVMQCLYKCCPELVELMGEYSKLTYSGVVLCDVKVRLLGEEQTRTFECLLNSRDLLQKILIAVWFWFILITILTIFNFLSWIFRITCCSYQTAYVINSDSDQKINQFLGNELKLDGRFLVRLFSATTNPVMLSEIVNEMFVRADQEMEANGNPAGLDVGSFAHPSGAVGGYLSIKLDSPKLPQQVLLPQV